MQQALYKVLYGGRDSAKSWTVAEYIIRRMTTESILVLCTREYQSSIADSVHRLLKNTIYRLGLQDWFRITKNSIKSLAGAEAIFKGLHHNIQEIKSTEGIHIVWVEEGQNTSAESLEILVPTIRQDNSEMIVTFNVTDVNAPIYDYFVSHPPPDTLCQQVNFDQNPFLSERSKATIEHMRATDIHTFEHVYLGMPKRFSEALIFGGRYRIAEIAPELWKKAPRLHYGLDFGFAQDPNALVREFIINNTLYIDHEAGGIGIEFAGELDSAGRGELEQMMLRVPEIRSGWPIKCDSARPETISFLRGLGFNTSAAEKWKGCVEDGITHIKGFNEIIIDPRCKELAQEARLYSYKRDPQTKEVLPVVLDKNNHYWDGVRYGLDGIIQNRGGLATWGKLAR